MADFKEIPRGEDDFVDEMRMEELSIKASVRWSHVKNYLIIDHSEREFGIFTESRTFGETAPSCGFVLWSCPWEGQTVWKETEFLNLDGSPVFCGYFFADLDEFFKDSKASMARLLDERAQAQLNPRL